MNDARLALLSIVSSSGGATLAELVLRAGVAEPTFASPLLSVTDVGLKIISPFCSELSRLSLSGCPEVGSEGLSAIASCSPRLSLLTLDRCRSLTDRSLLAVASSCSNLDTLCVSHCPGITHLGLAAVFSSLPLLSKIAVSGCPALTDHTLSLLRRRGLQVLKLKQCRTITLLGVALALESSSETLNSLSLVGCSGLGKDGSRGDAVFSTKFRRLQSLEISDCPTSVGDEFFLTLAAAAPGLRRLTLRASEGITDAGVMSLLLRLRGLSQVDFSRCRRITDRSVAALAGLVGSSLVSLSLEGCELVTDRSLALVARQCPRLAELDLTNCRKITDSGVAALSAEKPALELISLEGCEQLSDVSLPCLEEMADSGSLVSINLKRCSGLSHAAVESAHRHLWWCDLIC